jgi:hypothetical protein
VSLTNSEIESKFTGGPVARRLQSVAGRRRTAEDRIRPKPPAVTVRFAAEPVHPVRPYVRAISVDLLSIYGELGMGIAEAHLR